MTFKERLKTTGTRSTESGQQLLRPATGAAYNDRLTGYIFSGNTLLEHTSRCDGSEGIDSAAVAKQGVASLVEAWEPGGCTDEHSMDQLIIYMALASSPSQIPPPGPTSITSQHLETAIHFT